jgi:hypothetical protein
MYLRRVSNCWQSLRHGLKFITYLRSWALLEKPLIVQPLKNFPAFHATRRFDTVFKRALHWSLSWAISIQSTSSYPISVRHIWILSTHLRLKFMRFLKINKWEENELIFWPMTRQRVISLCSFESSWVLTLPSSWNKCVKFCIWTNMHQFM